MYTKFPCPSCGKTLKVSEEHYGQKSRCPHCKSTLTIPNPSDVPFPEGGSDAQASSASAASESGLDWLSSSSDVPAPVAATSPPAPSSSSSAAATAPAKRETKGIQKEAAPPKPSPKRPTVRPGTDVGILLSAAIGLVAAIVIVGLLFPIRQTYVGELLWDRGWVPFAEMFLFTWAMTVLAFKVRIIQRQRDAMLYDALPSEIGEEINPTNVDRFQKHLHHLMIESPDSLLLDRIHRCLELFRIRRDNQEVASLISSQSDLTANAVTSSYSIVKVAMWAIPILGFIGTVLGLSSAMGGLSSGLDSAADIEAVKGQLGSVTSGLGVSFDTTLVALVMSLFIAFPASTLQKQEEDLLFEIDHYCNENIVLRLRDGSVGASTVNATQLETAVQAALEAQRIVYRQAEEQMKRLVAQHEQSMKLVVQALAGLQSEMSRALRVGSAAVAGSARLVSGGVESLNSVLAELGAQPVVAAAFAAKPARSWFWWRRTNRRKVDG
jgi:DNA-directed RNA polymerase subunit RPC12/RpoP